MSELVKELMPYLEKLSDKLDSSAQVLWQMQMVQAKVALFASIIQYILIVLYCYGWYKAMVFFIKNEDESFPLLIFTTLVGGIIAIGLGFLAFSEITRTLTMLFNPEYWALQEIIKMVK